jgi:hypothetical protein
MVDDLVVTVVLPEPYSAFWMGSGLLGLALVGRRLQNWLTPEK